VFLEAHRLPPERIILDLDATDDPLHGHQEGRFFHGYYNCYCYLPLYIFCGRHLLAAKLRRSNIDGAAGAIDEVARIVAQIRHHWPRTRILLRGDSGFAREALMTWCEANRVDFLFGLARNERLEAMIRDELVQASLDTLRTAKPARRFKDFMWSTLDSWSRNRRVIGKAEVTQAEANPRLVVTSLKSREVAAQHLYEVIYCARGEMENRIKKCQVDLFALSRYHARQPASPVVRRHGLRAALRAATHPPGAHAVRRGNLQNHPPQTAETRRPGAYQRATHQARHGFRLSLAGRICCRSCAITQCRRLTRNRHRTGNINTLSSFTAHPAHGARPGYAASLPGCLSDKSITLSLMPRTLLMPQR
jgi:hypothetical protein